MEYAGIDLEYEGQKAENGKWKRTLDGGLVMLDGM